MQKCYIISLIICLGALLIVNTWYNNNMLVSCVLSLNVKAICFLPIENKYRYRFMTY